MKKETPSTAENERRADPLGPLLAPSSVAVVGASRDPRKRGHHAVRALLDSDFEGGIYPINPRGGELFGLTVIPSLDELTTPPDLAFIATPATTVPGILEECARAGVAGAIVAAAGFRESGDHGAALERAIVEVVRRTGIRMVGPNTSGVLNTRVGLNLVGVRDVRPGCLGLLSQSGNVGLALMREASAEAVGVSIYVGVGNETDVQFDEYLEYLGRDATTRAVIMYAEGMRDGRRFAEAAREVTRTKPIVLLKGGRSESGTDAARSHTGAIAGEYAVFRSALRQAGVTVVERTDELLPVGRTLAQQPPMRPGTGVAVLSDGGGHATLTADWLTERGVPLASLAEPTMSRLGKLLGPAASTTNPVDTAGAADQDPDVFTRALELLLSDPATGALMLVGLFGGYAVRFSAQMAEGEALAAAALLEMSSRSEKPLVVFTLYADTDSRALRMLREGGVAVVGSLEVACRCAEALSERGLRMERPLETPQPASRRTVPRAIEGARREGRTVLSELEARDLVADSGVPLVPATVCRTAAETAAAIGELSSAVAVKVLSPNIPHKTDADAVALGISNPEDGAGAFERMTRAAAEYARARGLEPDVRGVLVTRMLPPPIAELIVGATRDPHFGPIIAVGLGGLAVEVLRDRALRALPIGRADAFEMLAELRSAAILAGFRGRPPADLDLVADAILAVGRCARAHPELAAIEVNPLFVYAGEVIAVDASAHLV